MLLCIWSISTTIVRYVKELSLRFILLKTESENLYWLIFYSRITLSKTFPLVVDVCVMVTQMSAGLCHLIGQNSSVTANIMHVD